MDLIKLAKVNNLVKINKFKTKIKKMTLNKRKYFNFHSKEGQGLFLFQKIRTRMIQIKK
jgi:hypothetical protein